MNTFETNTDEVLDAVRDAIGPTIVVGGKTITWQWMLEGPPLRWLSDVHDYPMVIIHPLVTASMMGGGNMYRMGLPIRVYLVAEFSSVVSATNTQIYTALRRMGEAVLAQVMNVGSRLATPDIVSDRIVSAFGVDYDLTDALAESRLGVYFFDLTVTYFAWEVGG